MEADNKKSKKKFTIFRGKRQIDIMLFAALFAIILFGVVMVFSSSYYSTINIYSSPFYYLIRASFWGGTGLAVAYITSFIPVDIYRHLAVPFMLGALVLLVLLFTPLGVTVNNATRWINIGFTIMPGEIAKPAVICFLAWYYDRWSSKLGAWGTNFAVGAVPIGVLALALLGLIFLQPNLSTAMIIIFLIFAMMFVAGIKWVYLVGAAGAGFFGLFTYISTLGSDSEHYKRIFGYLTPFNDAQGEFYQTVQGLLALGAGGLQGVGIGNSVQKALYLPEAHNDYIFAIIGEEVGFIGIILFMLVYLFLIGRMVLTSIRAYDRFSMLLCAGCTMLLSLQVIMNIAVVTNLIPPTGIGLPFVSYGGNSTLLFAWMIGMVLNVSRSYGKKKTEQ